MGLVKDSDYSYKTDGLNLNKIPFIPESISGKMFEWNSPRQISLLVETSNSLTKLNTLSETIPHALLLKLHLSQEASKSSHIEGIKTTFEETITDNEYIPEAKQIEWKEVHCHLSAIRFIADNIKSVATSNATILEIHKILMSNSNGYKKKPGAFRQKQVWLKDTQTQQTTFTPPEPNKVENALQDLNDFWMNNYTVHSILKIAIYHARFETIHPFLDGNGRVGRIITLLQLLTTKILTYPVLPISSYIDKNKSEYYSALSSTSADNNFERWMLFYLQAMDTTAKNTIKTIYKIRDLMEEYDQTIRDRIGKRRKTNALKLLHLLYENPIITVTQITKLLAVSRPTAIQLANDLENIDILKHFKHIGKSHIYKLHQVLTIFKEHYE